MRDPDNTAPVVKGKLAHYPQEPVCPWCKQRKVLEPHSMALLSGGAFAGTECGSEAPPSEGLRGYLHLLWHGAHDDGEGDHREEDVLCPIADDVDGGEFDLIFCSVQCLREFLNFRLDQFERRVRELK